MEVNSKEKNNRGRYQYAPKMFTWFTDCQLLSLTSIETRFWICSAAVSADISPLK